MYHIHTSYTPLYEVLVGIYVSAWASVLLVSDWMGMREPLMVETSN